MSEFFLQDLPKPQTMTKSNVTSFKKTLIKKMMYRKWNEFRKKKKSLLKLDCFCFSWKYAYCKVDVWCAKISGCIEIAIDLDFYPGADYM